MEEHIFGTYATDDLKLVHHRANRQGIQHWHDLNPRVPAAGDPVTISVRVGPDVHVTDMAAYYTVDDSQPAGSRGVATNGAAVTLERVAVEWDSLLWGYVALWQGTLPAQPDGALVRYQISAWDAASETCADWPDAGLMVEKSAEAFFHEKPKPDIKPGDPSKGTTFSYKVGYAGPPAWTRDAVFYQVFPDRFHPGKGKKWLQTKDVSGICGGTLWGVADKLDYIEALGANAIWLTPIFPTPSHHGYDATDYRSVAKRLGGNEALQALVDQARARGIRIVLDLVCNHVSDEHPIFQEALADKDSPYREWFTWNDSAVGYRSFFGVKSMPQINLAHPGAREWMLDNARFWLREYNVDGYRLDYANGPGPDFWVDFTRACKEVNPEAFVVGEIVDSPSTIRKYVGRLDGNLDFHVETALRRTYAFETWSEGDFARFNESHAAYFTDDFVMPTFLDNHDTDRFLYVAGDDKDKLRRAAAAQMQLAGPPIIYYGTEVGLSQDRSKHGLGLEVSRKVMLWDNEQDTDLLAFYQQIIRERKERRAAGK